MSLRNIFFYYGSKALDSSFYSIGEMYRQIKQDAARIVIAVGD